MTLKLLAALWGVTSSWMEFFFSWAITFPALPNTIDFSCYAPGGLSNTPGAVNVLGVIWSESAAISQAWTWSRSFSSSEAGEGRGSIWAAAWCLACFCFCELACSACELDFGLHWECSLDSRLIDPDLLSVKLSAQTRPCPDSSVQPS